MVCSVGVGYLFWLVGFSGLCMVCVVLFGFAFGWNCDVL